MRICAHLHTHHSFDCNIKTEDIVDRAVKLGYDAIIITDHNTTKGAYEALEAARDRITVIVGAEFSTEKGHILCINIDDTIEKNCIKNGALYDFADLLMKVREQNGLLFLAHPIVSEVKTDMDFIRQLDGIELINSRVESGFHVKKARNLNKIIFDNYNLSFISGCDSHTIKELESTYMEVDISNRSVYDINELLRGSKTIFHKRTSYALVARNKLTQNKDKGTLYCIKQIIKMILGIFIDIKICVGGRQFEAIRICKKAE